MTSRSSQTKTFALVCEGTIFSLGALAVATNAGERVETVLVAPMQDQCDRMAGSPHDENRNRAYSPVGIGEIDPQAVAACSIAFKATSNPRYAFQLGRALNRTEQAGEAMGAYETAVNADYSAAKVNLGMLLGRLGDTGAEFTMYSQAAASGNVLAAYNLGVAYRDGLGTTQDAEKSLHWFEAAAAGGDDTAAFNIGAIYDEGEIVVEDNQMAIAWYDLAAKRGNRDAMINLALMFEGGEGIKANPLRAAELYAQAAAAGDTFGALKLHALAEQGISPMPEPTPDISSLPQGLDLLVLGAGDVDLPDSLLEI